MGRPVIVDVLRTPFGKRGGKLSEMHATRLLSHVQKETLRRNQLPAKDVGQIVGGCATPVGELGFNTTRMAWLAAGLPYEVAATTVDCVCGSSQQANHMVHNMIAAGVITVGIACGVESMSRVELGANTLRGPGRVKPKGFPYDMPDQFVAAERIAHKLGLRREQADALGLESQRRAAVAQQAGRFDREIVPIQVVSDEGSVLAQVARDEGLRSTSLESLRGLKATVPGGIHTAGNTSQISDGAAAVLWVDEDVARARGLTPRARVLAQAVVGTDPYFHIEGPLDVTRALFQQTGLCAADIDVFEINEAFAAVVLAWLRHFQVDPDRVNVNGGAIALGHPMGATGCRLLGAALAELERTDKRRALVAMCCGGAIATGTIIERC
jgi:acetyl-CoA C-acetyltransferase